MGFDWYTGSIRVEMADDYDYARGIVRISSWTNCTRKKKKKKEKKKEEIDRSIFRFSLFDKRTIDLISIMNREHRRRAFLRFLIPITLELALTTQSQFRFTKLR